MLRIVARLSARARAMSDRSPLTRVIAAHWIRNLSAGGHGDPHVGFGQRLVRRSHHPLPWRPPDRWRVTV